MDHRDEDSSDQTEDTLAHRPTNDHNLTVQQPYNWERMQTRDEETKRRLKMTLTGFKTAAKRP